MILAIVLLICLMPKKSVQPDRQETGETEITTNDPIDPSDPIADEPDSGTSDTETETGPVIDPVEGGLTPVEEKDSEESKQSEGTETVGTKIEKPIMEATIPKEDDPVVPGIVIGGNTPEPYQCGTPGHHCDGPETHAYVLNLELEGCPYCGSHSCPSFYATDEWGQTCYTPSKCPSYDIHADPVYYCQKCGKPCGDGRNGTCAEYNIDIDCPYCKAHVKSWTCHSCN